MIHIIVLIKGVYLVFRPFLFAFFFMKSYSGYIKMVIYHFYNTDRCHLTIFLRLLICYESLLSIIKRGPRFIILLILLK